MTERDLSAVNRFADLMRVKLRENDHKGHWEHCDPMWLLDRLRDEVQELATELAASMEPVGTSPDLIARECADVAAFAMMIADVVGALPYEPEHAATCQGCERWTKRIKELEARLSRVVTAASGEASTSAEDMVLKDEFDDASGVSGTERFLREKIERLKAQVRAFRNGAAIDLVLLNPLAEDAPRDAKPSAFGESDLPPGYEVKEGNPGWWMASTSERIGTELMWRSWWVLHADAVIACIEHSKRTAK